MYERNLPNRAGLTPDFQDGVTAFIGRAKSQHAYMEGEKIRCPCRKCKNEVFKTLDEVNFDLYKKDFIPEYYNWTSHGKEMVLEYFDAVRVPHLQDEQTPPALAEEGTNTHWGDAAEMNWDDIDLEYCKFYGEAKYKSIREQNPNSTKTPYAVLSFSPQIIPIIGTRKLSVRTELKWIKEFSPAVEVPLSLPNEYGIEHK
ncbi:UNVERIFIED_CONTAM: hypothetical protein Sradi_3635400 [Sesamum radiatum]|uniref:Transposase-associated domain-containing protein n=1 Tax=Sesamum radiatum TaxID=300843 RepID=A0AAW2QI20_SESRA